jgi:nucleotidyltransferase/DNA polymerase involved in DNA repair
MFYFNNKIVYYRYKEKVSLRYYREQSKKIMNIMRNMCDIFERASIDEAFMDITSIVKQRMNSEIFKNEWFGTVLGDLSIEKNEKANDLNIMLKIGMFKW